MFHTSFEEIKTTFVSTALSYFPLRHFTTLALTLRVVLSIHSFKLFNRRSDCGQTN